MPKLLLIVAAILCIGGCTSLRGSTTTFCRLDGQTLRIAGPTDDKLVHCLMSAMNVEAVEITSQGGSVRHAIAAARRVKTMDSALVIVGYCESSCANYILPSASRVRVAAGARVVLHGSVDHWAVERGATAELYALQRDFAAEMNIPPGWLLMRTSDDGIKGRHGPFVVDYSHLRDGGGRYIIVEPSFLASCLSSLPVTWDEPSYSAQVRASENFNRGLQSQGFVLSGPMRCAADQTYP